MKISNIITSLNKIVTNDISGVKLVHLTGDEKMAVFAIELAGNQLIPAHYHKKDIETYFILSGQGMVHTGRLEEGNIKWLTKKQVSEGDCFTIYPEEVHEFKNISEGALRILATAPLSHINEDRYFINEN
jgi:quercetin dioxygenase-like cupin family protein